MRSVPSSPKKACFYPVMVWAVATSGQGCSLQRSNAGASKQNGEEAQCAALRDYEEEQQRAQQSEVAVEQAEQFVPRFPQYSALKEVDFEPGDDAKAVFYGNSPEKLTSIVGDEAGCFPPGAQPSTARLLVTTDPAVVTDANPKSECANWQLEGGGRKKCRELEPDDGFGVDGCGDGGVKNARVRLVYLNETGRTIQIWTVAAPVDESPGREAKVTVQTQGEAEAESRWDAHDAAFRRNSYQKLTADHFTRPAVVIPAGEAKRLMPGREIKPGYTYEAEYEITADHCVHLYALAEPVAGDVYNRATLTTEYLRSKVYPIMGEYKAPHGDEVLACAPDYSGSAVNPPTVPAGGRAAGLYYGDTCRNEDVAVLDVGEDEPQGVRLFAREHAKQCAYALARPKHAADYIDGLYPTTTELRVEFHNSSRECRRVRWFLATYPGASSNEGPTCPDRILVGKQPGWALNGNVKVCSHSGRGGCKYVRTILSKAFWQSPLPMDLKMGDAYCANRGLPTREDIGRPVQGGYPWNHPQVPGFLQGNGGCGYERDLAPGESYELKLVANLPAWSSAPLAVISASKPCTDETSPASE